MASRAAGLRMYGFLLASLLALPTTGTIPVGNDAWRMALLDARALPRETCCYYRWIWITDADVDSALATGLAVNLVSRSQVIYRVPTIGAGSLMLLRVDLRELGLTNSDTQDYVRIWEQFQFDPRFSRLFTKDLLKFNGAVVFPLANRWIEQACEPYVVHGQTYTAKWAREPFRPVLADLAKLDVIRTPAQSLDPRVVGELCDLTGSDAPVVSHPYFVIRALSTIQNKDLYKTLYGGLYFDLVGFKRNVKGKTDLENILAGLGVNDAKKLFDELGGDKKVAVFRSNVTGKPRAVKIFRTAGGLVRITEDLKDEDIDLGVHPLFNLLDFKFSGQELIFESPNGLQRYAQLNGAGKLVDEVPFDIAVDTTIPAPHSRRLQAALSCIACHGPNDGVQPLTNDVPLIAKRTNILGDQGQDLKNFLFDPQTTKRLVGLYAGDPKKLLFRAKDDYAEGVLRATGPWKSANADQSNIVQVASAKLTEIRKLYWYDRVTPARALPDVGIAPGPDPVKKLQDSLRVNPGPIGLEDVRAAALLEGIGLNRTDWDLAFDFIAVRTTPERPPAKEKQK